MNSGIKTEINLSFLPRGPQPPRSHLGAFQKEPDSVVYSSLLCHADFPAQEQEGGVQLKASVYRPSFLPLPSLPFIAACSRALLYGAFYGAGYQTVILGPLLCLKMERRNKLKLSASGMLDRLRSDVLIFDNSVAQNLSVTSFENTFLILSNCRPFS